MGKFNKSFERKKKAPAKILQLLDHIRNDYRNPTQHPEARYSIDEAQDLLPLMISACNKMHSDLSK